jgi:hypothetical protein
MKICAAGPQAATKGRAAATSKIERQFFTEREFLATG